MSEHKDKPKKKRARTLVAQPKIPENPDCEFAKDIRAQAEVFRRRNHNAAVALALQAQRGEGDFVDFFNELGRRYGDTLPHGRPSQTRRKLLTVINGGKA